MKILLFKKIKNIQRNLKKITKKEELKMNSKCLLLLSLLIFTLFLRSNSSDDCKEDKKGYNCGAGCTGTPKCGLNKHCGNKDNMCYCDCDDNYIIINLVIHFFKIYSTFSKLKIFYSLTK